MRCFPCGLLLGSLLIFSIPARALDPVPDKLVVLTFDDSVASQHSVVRPLLKRHGFGATFFITEGFSFATNKQDYMTWEQIAELHRDGFEIGNHTVSHMGVTADTLGRLTQEVEGINQRCAEHGIPKPVSFGYPGNAIHAGALPLLKQLGFKFGRRGGEPEFPYKEGRGTAFDPGADHPLLIPSAGDSRPDGTLADLQRAAMQARDGRIAVLQFHGVPDRDHPWVHTPPERFEAFLGWLKGNGYRVVALRDLARYVDPERVPAAPLGAIERRRASPDSRTLLQGEIVDADSGQILPARLYLQDQVGKWYFPDSASTNGTSITYQRKSSFQASCVEMHTTLSAHPFAVLLPPGRYIFTVERGKEYRPLTNVIEVAGANATVRLPLKRWINLADRGWYSGDTHNHRDPRELANVMLAEDVNVACPMVQWTRIDTISPAQSPDNMPADFATGPVAVDATHVWSPRNTEYEIFRTAGRSHTLGAVLVVNHRTPFNRPVFPLADIATQARSEGGLIDLEKHNWNWSAVVIPLLKPDLFELANNHHWRVDFGVRNWALPAPPWMNAGTGIDTERHWTLYGFQTYYALLDCGFRIQPAAGTANGVHPVPLGFGRVYVHVPEGFTHQRWMENLAAGRSFVTTGPILLARVDGKDPGEIFNRGPATQNRLHLEAEIHAEQPQVTVTVVVSGDARAEVPVELKQTSAGAWSGKFETDVEVDGTGWIAVRCFEERDGGRFRFAHTAPWHVTVTDKPLRPRREEVGWFVERTKEEIARNRGVISDTALGEYEQALAAWERIAATSR